MATNLAINLSEDNMLAQVTGPDDLKNYFHMDPLGDLLLLDNKMLPIPLSAPRHVTAYQKIHPHTFWNNRQTRQCTTNTTSPLPKHLHRTSLHDHHASSPVHVTSPIPLEDIRSIRKDLADDLNIPKDVLMKAMADLSQFQVSVIEHKAKHEQDFTVRIETAQKAMLQDMQKHMAAFDNFREQALQKKKRLRAELNSQRLTTNDLIDQNNAVRQDLANENAALHDKVKHLNVNLVTYPTLTVGLMNNWKPLMSQEDSLIDPPLPVHNHHPQKHIETALCTSKGDLHQEINEMVECNYGWNTMKSKLRTK